VGRDELERMLAEQRAEGKPDELEVNCHFCGASYHFPRAELEALF